MAEVPFIYDPSVAYVDRVGFVYFILAADVRRLKIGFSENHPSGRMMDLSVGCPVDLVLLGYRRAGRATEGLLHHKFRDLWVRGEWFKYHARLRRFVERETNGVDPEVLLGPEPVVAGEVGPRVVSRRPARPSNAKSPPSDSVLVYCEPTKSNPLGIDIKATLAARDARLGYKIY